MKFLNPEMKDPLGQSKLNLKCTFQRHGHFTEELFSSLTLSQLPHPCFFFFLMQAGKGFDVKMSTFLGCISL